MEIFKEDAIRLFGNGTRLARALGISPAAVSQWHPHRPIPAVQAYRIRYELRPDAFTKNHTIKKRYVQPVGGVA